MTSRIDRGTVRKVAGVLVALAAWQSFAMSSGSRLIPQIQDIAIMFVELAGNGELADHTLTSLSQGLLGLFIAFSIASAAGYAAARNWAVDAAIHPLISLAYPVPKLALYPLVILLLGLGWESRTAQVALECFFPLFVHAHAGAKAVAPRMEWLARNVDASPWQAARDVIVPSAMPYMLTGLRIAIPIMLIVTTVTEFIGDSQGLGYLIARSASYFDTASAFAVIVVLGTLGLLGDRLVVLARDRLVFWEKGASL
ncbi:MAG: ABC transporter permease [Defluviicoccus sp.]|nr:ABC transporter permease [Defluviicoccus sp.]